MGESVKVADEIELVQIVDIGTNQRLCIFCWQDGDQVFADLLDSRGRSVCESHSKVIVGQVNIA